MADYDMSLDATAYGGKETGFDPAYSEQVGGDSVWNSSVDNYMPQDFYADDLSSMYSYGGPSTGVYGNASSPNTTPFAQGLANVNDFFNNNKFGKIAGMALNFTPAGKAFNVARGVGTMLGQGNMMGAGVTALGAFGGLPGAVVNAGYQASQGRMGPAGSLAGGLALGPAGAFAGGQLGGMVNGRAGGTPGINGNVPNQGGEGGFSVEGLAGGLAQLYAASQANSGLKGLGANNDAVNQQIQTLGSMYGPNSPYAAQLRQTLERKDAASGRRSQYGPREAQLMAMLADKQAGVAGTIGNLATSSQNNQIALNNQRNQTRAQQLALLMNVGKQSGAFNALGNMFRPQPAEATYDDSTWMGTE